MLRLGKWIDRHLTAWHILLAGWLVFLAYCYPGFMSYDSCVQLEQARGLQPMTNWHPPLMALLWKLCDSIIAGPFLMLVIQSVSLLAGMHLILRRVMSERGAAIAAALILLSPPVIVVMGVVWKDSQMAGFLMLGIAMLMRRTRASLALGCWLMWLATAQRYNAAAATLPIVVLLFEWKQGLVRWKRYVIATCAWLVITMSAGMTNSHLAAQREGVFASLAMNDIVGVIRFHRNYTDEQIRADAPRLPWSIPDHLQDNVHKLYRPDMTWLDVTERPPTGVFIYPKTDEENAIVAKAWRTLIAKYPGAYLYHRWRVFLAELRILRRNDFYFWPSHSDTAERETLLSTMNTYSWLQVAWRDGLVALVDTPLFFAWVWFMLCVALIWPCRRDIVALTIVLSGAICEGGLLIVAPAIDYRYSHWMVTCAIVAAVYAAAARRKTRRDARA